ncbi:MAG TPA: zf-HC2 domain-containing protein, partial [Candidatus Tumulicola sp.]
MKYEHVEDLAALYALGALSDEERAGVDAHLRECPACAKVVGDAENGVALMLASEPQRTAPAALEARIDGLLRARPIELRPRSRGLSWSYPLAVAAALLLGLMPAAYFWNANRAMHGTILAQNSAIGRLASVPHMTARFHSSEGTPAADVMYAPDGSWYVIVVRNASKTLSVAWMHDGSHTMLG